MNKKINNAAQAGFTLIELIVVIVILGILAATALPKFASMGGDARAAAVNAAKGSLASAGAMVHGKSLINPSATTATLEDGTAVSITNGYPAAASAANATTLQKAAGLEEWTVVNPSNDGTDTFTPVTTATQVAFIPASVAGTTTGATCYVMYTESTAKNVPPVVTAGTTCE